MGPNGFHYKYLVFVRPLWMFLWFCSLRPYQVNYLRKYRENLLIHKEKKSRGHSKRTQASYGPIV